MRKHSPSSRGIRAFEYLVENFEAGIYARNTELAKIELSGADTARFSYRLPDTELSKMLSRAAFEAHIADALVSMKSVAERCLTDADIGPNAVTDIIMVGGSTFVPAVESLFLEKFPGARITGNDRFGAVAKGLALHGR